MASQRVGAKRRPMTGSAKQSISRLARRKKPLTLELHREAAAYGSRIGVRLRSLVRDDVG
jgi:hypothetical protein